MIWSGFRMFSVLSLCPFPAVYLPIKPHGTWLTYQGCSAEVEDTGLNPNRRWTVTNHQIMMLVGCRITHRRVGWLPTQSPTTKHATSPKAWCRRTTAMQAWHFWKKSMLSPESLGYGPSKAMESLGKDLTLFFFGDISSAFLKSEHERCIMVQWQ